MGLWRKLTRRGALRAGALGKLPATDYGDANVTLKMVQAAALPTAPSHFGHGTMFSSWGMLGNDSAGDCTCAGADHEHMLWTGIGNRGSLSSKFTTANTISDYSKLSGYNPVTGANDNGVAVDQLMNYRRTTGMVDAAGKRHKIDLGVRLGGSQGNFDWTEFINAVWCFKAVAIGTLVPYSAMRQFNQGQPWSDVGDQNIDGGHYIPAVGSQATDSQVTFITWGVRWIMMRSFFEAYVDELWVPLSEEAMGSIESATKTVDWLAVERVASSLG
jgi:hypothetical protein